MTDNAEAADARRKDPLRLATPRIDDVEARRARASVESRLFPGTAEALRVGRYKILGRIGQGGMGVVYRAHDPELARDVAVKLMNAESIDEGETATARTRLVREARAMAGLAHPNVIHVYDVGAVEDGVFIAMELVEGESLAGWIARAPRDWRDVLRRYLDAGRGLAAAHAAGVIHRDFKPENVLVGTDDRVRVGDFGLAGAPIAGPAPEGPATSDAELDVGIMSGSLTRTGALLGTPKYMAPEQENGAIASAASDQFSFCVALYEGLFGEPPFEGETFAKYRAHVRAGEIRPAPLEAKVPKWVREEICRGLAVDPDARHPSIEALLDALSVALADPVAPKRPWLRRMSLALIVVPLIASAVALGIALGGRNDGQKEALVGPADPAPQTLPVTTPVGVPTPVDAKAPDAKAPEIATPIKPPPEKKKPNRDDGVAQGPKKSGTCYQQEDGNEFIVKKKGGKMGFVRGKGKCWECRRPAPRDLVPHLDPSDCAHYYLCAPAEDDECNG